MARLSVEPLIKVAGSACALADRMGVDTARLSVARREGLTVWTADRWAVTLGLHPAMVWPEWETIEPGDASAAFRARLARRFWKLGEPAYDRAVGEWFTARCEWFSFIAGREQGNEDPNGQAGVLVVA